METRIQNLAWSCLPKKTREALKRAYKYQCQNIDYNRGFNEALEEVFNRHNLTSDTEPEEILMVERKELIKRHTNALGRAKESSNPTETYSEGYYDGQTAILEELFGDKCLPDKEPMKIDAADSLIAMAKDEMGITEEQPSVQVELKFHKGDTVKNKLDGKIYKIHEGNGFYLLENEDGTIKDGSVAEQYLEPYTEENKEPKYHVGQKVWVEEKVGEPLEITAYKGNGKYFIRPISCDVEEEWIIPFEGESKETMKECSYTDGRTCDTYMGKGWGCGYKPKGTMGEKEPNLCELLKGCEGERFYSPVYGDVVIDFNKDNDNIEIWSMKKDAYLPIASNGHHADNPFKGFCILYPSRALYEKYPLDAYSAWMEWKETKKSKSTFVVKAFIGEENGVGWNVINEHFTFDSEEEAQQAADGIREYLKKFH